jgi:hypothetical protein
MTWWEAKKRYAGASSSLAIRLSRVIPNK